ncbi:uncharacterized protein DFL_005109 [Arthrobotrys flagrans]|uniref:Peptidase A1 domain-containing protein n=1 Tax=Arthrobotrys flagrans TaxID=97331 RepID=A0A437A6S7_ARTFL|nr:hypothetical protein DFL_005109 [Arthrobotrys flagrans]
MDTGSTGIVIDAKYGFSTTYLQRNCEIGHVFYTSSHWLQEDYWCTTDVDVGGVVTSALALIRTNEVCCPKFSEWDRCQTPEKADIEDRSSTVGKAYMGIGFARGNPPSHNLFMNIKPIDGVPVGSKFRTGYGEPPCEVQINNSSWVTGTFLTDTGIPNAYAKGDVAHKEGNEITIRIPDPSIPFGEAKFVSVPKAKAGTIGTDNLMQPTWVGTRSILGVNTGRKFYNGYDLYFDGDGGYFGLKKNSN